MSEDQPLVLDTHSVLVVEDEVFSQNTIVRLLEGLGAADVTVVANGVEALAHLESADRPPDLLFVDVVMPEMGGVELMRTLGERDYPGAIILISGTEGPTMNSLKRVAEFRGLKVLGCIAKPATKTTVTEVLDGL